MCSVLCTTRRLLREQWIRAKYERNEFEFIEKQEPYSAGTWRLTHVDAVAPHTYIFIWCDWNIPPPKLDTERFFLERKSPFGKSLGPWCRFYVKGAKHSWQTASGTKHVVLDAPILSILLWSCTPLSSDRTNCWLLSLRFRVHSYPPSKGWVVVWLVILKLRNLEISLGRNFTAHARNQLARNIHCFLWNI